MPLTIDSKRVSIESGHNIPKRPPNYDDPGVVVFGENNIVLRKEADITRDICEELNRQLKRHGIITLVSYDEKHLKRLWESSEYLKDLNYKAEAESNENINNNYEPPSQRAIPFTKFEVRAFKPDVHIQVHVNKPGKEELFGKIKGVECFYYDKTDYFEKSKYLCGLVLKNVKKLIPAACIDSRGDIDENGKKSGMTAASLYSDSFGLLNEYYKYPGVYCETGYIDNDDDYATFDTKEKRNQYGTAYARAIIEFLDMKWIPESGRSFKRPIFPSKILGRDLSLDLIIDDDDIPYTVKIERRINGKVVETEYPAVRYI